MRHTPESQSQTAYLALERKIIMLEIEPGAIVSEAAIIELSGVGRTPAREALQRLSLEGLVEIRPRAGIRIAEIRPDDFSNVLEVRRVLEPRLTLLSTRFATGPQRRRVEECREEMALALERRDTGAFLEADKAFDTAMGNACPNPYLAATLRPLQSHSRRFWYRFFADTGLESSVAAHRQVMDEFIKGDAEAAAEGMAALIEAMQKSALSLRNAPAFSPDG
ncbi:GntR family transcriptional regulator [Pelagibacterium sp. 26DY04]|uniref:GntR family transcriptional regulator n=1 Tax=Pelagibacterium sp. 26DY04 TaxID=2967130 RepID=UPI0028164052|nr:GntR family transcriptional regulator [Pelagibacterium sp. 26DY04]WMT87686.1 GntR family transcriptional regulator [Pelagibacterium sp. 26DY04]